MRWFYFIVTQNGEIPCGRTVSGSSELMLSYFVKCFLKLGVLLSFGSVLFSSPTHAFELHALGLFLVILSLRAFFLITDWSQGIFFGDRNGCFKEADQQKASEILSLRHSTEISLSCEARLVVFVTAVCVSCLLETPCTLWSLVKERIDLSDYAAQKESPGSRYPAESNL